MPGRKLLTLARGLTRHARGFTVVRNIRLQEHALDASRDGVVITGTAEQDHRILYVNPAFERTYGYSMREIAGLNCRFLQAGDTRQPALDELRAALREGREFTGVVRNYHKDGRLIHNELSISPVRDRKGRLTNFIGIQNDITGRVRAEQGLEESERQLRVLLAQYDSEMITILDPDGTPRYESPAVERALGYGHMEEAGEGLLQNVHPDDAAKLSEAVAGCLAGPGQSPPVEYRLRHADGSWRHFESVGNNLANDPEIRGVVINTRDITDRKLAEEARRRSDEYFRAVVHNSSEIVKVVKPDGALVYASPAFERNLGYGPGRTEGMNVLDCVHPEDIPRVAEDTRKALEELESGSGLGEAPTRRTEYRFLHADGSWRYIEGVGTYLLDHPGIEGVVINARDVTERKQAEEALAESEERFRQLFEHSVDALFVHDAEGRIRDVNPEACRSTGYSREELLSMRVGDLADDLISPQERAEREREGGTLWQRIVSGDSETHAALHLGEHRCKDGTKFPIEVRLGGVAYGGERLILASARDITERRELESQLEHLAYHDDLTGLPNRVHFMDRMEQALARAEKTGSSIAVLFLDLDDFKLVNDSLGHSTGDLLLAAVARRLEGCLRPGDVVARFGGDEFTILLEDTYRVENATLVAERVAERLGIPVALGGQEIFVKVSAGIAFSAPGSKDPETLMRDADATMYRAKAAGKGHYEVSDPSMNLRAVQRLQLENDLRRAAENLEESFEVHYQPKVSVETGEIEGMEALVRWRLPGGEVLYPESFIPRAEESGLIVAIGHSVLRAACDFSRAQREAGNPANVCINLSARQFYEPDLVQRISDTLRETGADPESLVLEITEGVVLEYERVFEKLRELKRLGVKIHLDDFGTGYSSLSYLKHLPVDAVKIDKVFVDGLGKSREDTVLVSAIISLARALGLEVVAEGVQTSFQLERLRELGCPQAQGYLFSRPLSANEASGLLNRGVHLPPTSI